MEGEVMSLTSGPSISELCDALGKASERYAGMLRQVKDPAPPAVGSWNVGDTAVHTAVSSSYFLMVAQGQSEPLSVDSDHKTYFETNLDVNFEALAERFTAGERALIDYARGLDGDPEVEIFKGVIIPTSALMAVELCEVLVHGYDIAKASGLDWQIPKPEAALAIEGLLPLWAYGVDSKSAAGLKARFELRIRGGVRKVLAFDEGRLTFEEPSDIPADCYLSIDPVALLLLSFNRIQPWGPMLQGKMGAWGRRFWLAGKFPSLFKGI